MRVSEVSKVSPTFCAKPMPKNIAQNLKDQLLSKQVKTVDIFCHGSPDEDTVNAMKVMYNWLKQNGKKVAACLDDSETTGLYLNKLFYHKKNKNDKTPADKFLCVDFNAIERIPFKYSFLKSLKDSDNVIGFDHHEKSDTTMKSKNLYIDNTAASCCGVVYRFFEALGENLSNKDLKSLYCGMLSDYKGSKLANIKKTDSGYELIKRPALLNDENSLDVLNKIEASLSDKDKNEIYNHLDIMSRLSPKEKELMTSLAQNISFSMTHNLAFVFIEPGDKQWLSMGCDNVKTSAIMKDIRTRAMENFEDDDLFTPYQKECFKKMKAIAIFYRVDEYTDSAYQVSIHSKDGYAEKLINSVCEKNPDFMGGGHPDRAGGRISSCKYADALKMVNDFIEADFDLKHKG